VFDLGWGELLIVGVVALIVVGPKDLPGMFKSVGQVMGRMRGMAREFQRAMDRAASETGVKDLSTGIKAVTSPKQLGMDKFNEIADRMKDGLNLPDNKIMSTDLKEPPKKKNSSEKKVASSAAKETSNGDDAVSSKNNQMLAEDKEPTASVDENAGTEIISDPNGGETNKNVSVR